MRFVNPSRTEPRKIQFPISKPLPDRAPENPVSYQPPHQNKFWPRLEETGLPRSEYARGCRGDSAARQVTHRRYSGAFKPVYQPGAGGRVNRHWWRVRASGFRPRSGDCPTSSPSGPPRCESHFHNGRTDSRLVCGNHIQIELSSGCFSGEGSIPSNYELRSTGEGVRPLPWSFAKQSSPFAASVLV